MITGTTRVFAQIGHPVLHVRTPEIFNAAFAERGIDAVTVAVDVSSEELPQLITGLRAWRNLAGIGVTVPHKQEIVPLVDELGPRASLVRAVNVIRREADGRLIGEMNDGIGFVTGLCSAGHDLAGRRVIVIGAGGAGRAIAFAVGLVGPASLAVADRLPERADQLARDLALAYPRLRVRAGEADPRDHDVVVNATSSGMHYDDDLPVDPDLLDPKAVVAEVIMQPAVTPLLLAAERRGCAIHLGGRMLDAQLELNLDYVGLWR